MSDKYKFTSSSATLMQKKAIIIAFGKLDVINRLEKRERIANICPAVGLVGSW